LKSRNFSPRNVPALLRREKASQQNGFDDFAMWRFLLPASAFIFISLASCLSQQTESRESLSETLEERFGQLDANGDGLLTIEEVGRPRLFRRLDANGDNVVTRAEAAAALESRSRRSRQEAASSEREAAPHKGEVGIAEDLNIPYSSLPGVDPNLLSLDIYKPQSSSNNMPQAARPVIVMIHGGAWRSGDKGNESQGYRKASFFVSQGYVYVSINYRLSPAVQHPAHVEDVAKAVAWVSDHIANYGGDPKRIFLMGHSAGAHLAALVTTDESYLRKLGKSPTKLSGVILLDTAGYDIARNIEELSKGPFIRSLYENAFGRDRQTWIDASPIRYVKSEKSLPPFLVFYTERESSETISKEFVQALQKAGVPSAAILAQGKNHQTLNQDIGRPGDSPSELILEFLQGKAPETFPPSS
jgi:arylformamidase